MLPFTGELLTEIKRVPGVENAASTTYVPLMGGTLGDGRQGRRRRLRARRSPGSAPNTSPPWTGGCSPAACSMAATRRRRRRVAIVNEAFMRVVLPGAGGARQDADDVRGAGLSGDALRDRRRARRCPARHLARRGAARRAGARGAVPRSATWRRLLRARRRRRGGDCHRQAPAHAPPSGHARRLDHPGAARPGVAGARAVDGDALGLLRRARRAARHDRPLRRDGLRDAAAAQRSGHPPGAGRAARPGRAHGAARSGRAGRRRRPRRRRARRAGGTRDRVAAVRPVADRRRHVR